MEIVTIIFSGLLTVLTGYYVWLTHKISKTNSDLLLEQIRPFVVVRFEAKDMFLNIVFENLGLRPAYDINVRFNNLDQINNLLLEKRKNESLPYFANAGYKIAFLSSKDIIRDMLNQTPIIFNKENYFLPDLEVTLNYADSKKIKYSETYKISISNVTHSHKIVEFSQNHHLTKIEKEIKNVSEQLKVLVRQIDKNN
jgi:hypothetical protein